MKVEHDMFKQRLTAMLLNIDNLYTRDGLNDTASMPGQTSKELYMLHIIKFDLFAYLTTFL